MPGAALLGVRACRSFRAPRSSRRCGAGPAWRPSARSPRLSSWRGLRPASRAGRATPSSISASSGGAGSSPPRTPVRCSYMAASYGVTDLHRGLSRGGAGPVGPDHRAHPAHPARRDVARHALRGRVVRPPRAAGVFPRPACSWPPRSARSSWRCSRSRRPPGRCCCALGTLGLGLAIFSTPNFSAIMGSVPRSQLGVASGMFTTSRFCGMGVSIAILGAIAASNLGRRRRPGHPAGRAGKPQQRRGVRHRLPGGDARRHRHRGARRSGVAHARPATGSAYGARTSRLTAGLAGTVDCRPLRSATICSSTAPASSSPAPRARAPG